MRLDVEHRWPAPRPDAGSRWCRSAHPCAAPPPSRARRAPRRSCPGSDPASSAAGAPPAFRTPETASRRRWLSFSVGLRWRRSRRRDRRPWRGSTPPGAEAGYCARSAARSHPAGRARRCTAAPPTASAPPTAPENAAMLLRSMFTRGSRRVIMRHAVSADTIGAASGSSPQACSTRAHSCRNARNLAMVRNSSASAASRKSIMRARCIERDAGAFQRAQIGDRDRKHEGQLLRLRAAGVVDDPPVGGGERPSKPRPRKLADLRGKAPAPDRASGIGAPPPRPCAPIGLMRRTRMSTAAGAMSARLHQRGEVIGRRPWGLRTDVEVDGDAGVEIDAVEHAGERLLRSASMP